MQEPQALLEHMEDAEDALELKKAVLLDKTQAVSLSAWTQDLKKRHRI
jgi:hypothetical protein